MRLNPSGGRPLAMQSVVVSTRATPGIALSTPVAVRPLYRTVRVNVGWDIGEGHLKETLLNIGANQSIASVMEIVKRRLGASNFEVMMRKLLLFQDVAIYEAPVHSVR